MCRRFESCRARSARLTYFVLAVRWILGSVRGLRDLDVRRQGGKWSAAQNLRRLGGMKITFLPHAEERMRERGISAADVYRTLENPDLEYPGRLGRIVAEHTFAGRRLAVKVVYNLGLEDERIVVTVELGRSMEPPEGGEE